MRLFTLLSLFFLIGFSNSSRSQSSTKSTPANTSGQLGINLANVSYYSSEIVFNDAFKVAKPWISQAPGKPYGQGGSLEQDRFGNIKKLADGGQFAESLIFADIEGHYPAGNYTCLFEGEGEIDFMYSAKVTKREIGKLTVSVQPKNGPIGVKILKTNPKNPLRNLRLMLPGTEKSKETFHADFLKSLEGFKVIRFMDWGRINNSKAKEWSDRTTPQNLFQGSEQGVAIEFMIELANQLKVDPWICLPHGASDDYIKEFCTLVKEKLSPKQKLYFEFSNETWNGTFEQARECQKLGLAKKLSENAYEAQLRYSTHRALESFKIATEILGSDRLVRVLAPQAANPWTGTVMMDYANASKSVDSIAIAPYFGNWMGDPQKTQDVLKLKVEGVLEECQKSLRENKVIVQKYVDECGKRKLELIAYEGGQHLAGYNGAENNEELTKLFLAANRHPRMKQLYLEDLQNWKESGAGLFCHYHHVGLYSKWGSWGVKEFSTQDDSLAPKWQALREWREKK